MPKTKSPFILDNISTSKAQQISEAIESIDLERQDIAELVEKLQIALLTGSITLSRDDKTLLRDMARKYIADAPKEVKVEQKIRVEEYIGIAMEANLDSYRTLQEAAKEFAEIEETKARSLYESKQESDKAIEEADFKESAYSSTPIQQTEVSSKRKA